MQGLRLNGAAQVVMVDKNPDRAAFAQALGADRSLTSLDDLERDVYDAVVDATGVVEVMSRTLEELQRGIELIENGHEQVRKVMILPNG